MKYLMATNTDYVNGKLTGAHYRFLELAKGLARTDNVLIVSRRIPQLEGCSNIAFSYISDKDYKYIPDHIATIIKIIKRVKKLKRQYTFDASISLTPFITIAFGWSGLSNIVSLFREDLIGYHSVIGTSRAKILYYSLIEKKAVSFSKKIIVQCKNDKYSLIRRTQKYDKNVSKKVYVQINNANTSWMFQNQVCCHKPYSETNILFLGEFSNCRKGHGILLPAIARLLDNGRKIQLFVAGDGKELLYYKRLYEDYKDIHFLGRINVKEYMSQIDIVIVPSLIDSCPNTVLEGLNAGVAVYGANTGGIPDILQNSEYVFEPNIDALEKFLNKVLDNKKYISDAKDQQCIQKQLTFDWAEKIKGIIDEQL